MILLLPLLHIAIGGSGKNKEKDWLIDGESFKARTNVQEDTLRLSNGLVSTT